MDRNEAVLRELNLHPLWQRRGAPAPVAAAEIMQEVPTSGYAVPTLPAQTPPLPPKMEGASMEDDRQRENQLFAPALPSIPQAETDIAPNKLSATHDRSELGNPGWQELKQQVRDCTACRLRAGCTRTVFGTGDEQAEWLFVGEGPGADEDAQGEPFVGQAGKLLDSMLLAINLKRGKNVYIANIVKCRPPNNRAPERDEITACLPYLQRQIELIKPKLIVALGKTAATSLLGQDRPLASLRGKPHDYNGIPLIITYHPAYLLRSPMEKAKSWQDLCLAVQTRHDER
ncbi:MAG: uracil-DNA glycosylase [Gallionella sp.]|nr:uracil-DNA glycosylase [Gallionella sp.]